MASAARLLVFIGAVSFFTLPPSLAVVPAFVMAPPSFTASFFTVPPSLKGPLSFMASSSGGLARGLSGGSARADDTPSDATSDQGGAGDSGSGDTASDGGGSESAGSGESSSGAGQSGGSDASGSDDSGGSDGGNSDGSGGSDSDGNSDDGGGGDDGTGGDTSSGPGTTGAGGSGGAASGDGDQGGSASSGRDTSDATGGRDTSDAAGDRDASDAAPGAASGGGADSKSASGEPSSSAPASTSAPATGGSDASAGMSPAAPSTNASTTARPSDAAIAPEAPTATVATAGASRGETASDAEDRGPVDPLASNSDYKDTSPPPRTAETGSGQPQASAAVERPAQSLPEAIAGLLGLKPSGQAGEASAPPAPGTPVTQSAPAATPLSTPAAVSSTGADGGVSGAARAEPGPAAAPATPPATAPAPAPPASLAEVPADPGAAPAPSLARALSTLLGGGQRREPDAAAPQPAAASAAVSTAPEVAPAPVAVPPAAARPAAPAPAPVAAAPVPAATSARAPSAAPRPAAMARAARIAPSSGGAPVFRRDEVTALGMNARARQVVGALGFRILSERRSQLLGNQVVAKLRTPRNQSAESALRRLRATLPELVFDYAHLYRSAGDEGALPVRYAADLVGVPAAGTCRVDVRIGLIDTGVGRHPALSGTTITQRSFVARDASRNVTHGTAVASILVGNLPGATPLAPGARLYSANVFAGEGKALRADALAIIEALDWMAAERVPVVNLSLMGPDNDLVARAVRAAAERGLILVAAAGNAGPEAPPAFPAAYPAVISVAAIDARGRPYARNNRGTYVEIAAPGVDIWAADARLGGEAFWTGTSFAVPFVTAVVASDVAAGRARDINDSRRRLAASARDLGAPGRDPIFGHGLVRMPGCASGEVLSTRSP